MKNTIKKLLVSLCAFVLVLTMAGCSTFANNNMGNLPNSGSLAGAVTFNTATQPEKQISMAEACAKVNRSVVKIAMMNNGSQSSLGSGVIVDISSADREDGQYYILTCHHVISSALDIIVYVPDENCRNHGDEDYNEDYIFKGSIGKSVENQEVFLIGGDRNSDVAVLKLDVGQKNVKIAQSLVPDQATTKIMQGQEVFAIGNPSGDLPMTFLKGSISYIDRSVTLSEVGYMTLIQHDCMITHGSSGGGLYNLNGELIGITNAGSDTYKGMNYAVPYYGENGFIKIAKQLIASYCQNPSNYGYISGRWNFGFSVKYATHMVENATNVYIALVEQGGNCDFLQVNDFITGISFNDKIYVVKDQSSLLTAIFEARKHLKIGDKFEISVLRPSYTTFGYLEGYTKTTLKGTISKQLIFCDTGVYPAQ